MNNTSYKVINGMGVEKDVIKATFVQGAEKMNGWMRRGGWKGENRRMVE